MKKKILRVFLILLVLIIIFCIRNLVIIRKYEKALYEFRMNPNHYFYRDYGTETNNVIEVFYKDGKVKVLTRTKEKEPKIYWSQYGDDNTTTQIMVIEETKKFIVYENSINVGLHGNIPYNYTFMEIDPYYENNGTYAWYQKLLGNLMYSLCPVISTEYNGVKCYEINYRLGFVKIAKIYIDKETYLPIATMEMLNNQVETYGFKTDSVTDEEVTMPDISEYTQSVQGEN